MCSVPALCLARDLPSCPSALPMGPALEDLAIFPPHNEYLGRAMRSLAVLALLSFISPTLVQWAALGSPAEHT